MPIDFDILDLVQATPVEVMITIEGLTGPLAQSTLDPANQAHLRSSIHHH